MKTIFIWMLLSLGLQNSMAMEAPASRELSLREALDLMQANSPDLKVAKVREIEAESSTNIAKSHYYPKIHAQAIDSWGFAGSSSALGIDGLMGSPFRSGFAGGLVAEQTLLDFGRTKNRVESQRQYQESSKHDTQVVYNEVYTEVIHAYFGCALNRAQKETWKELENQADLIESEVKKFVATGQRSVVDRLLAETQKQEALTAIADYETRQSELEKHIALLIGLPDSAGKVGCPSLNASENFKLTKSNQIHPIVAKAMADLKAVQSEFELAKSERWPKLLAVGSAGYMDATRLTDSANYSVGVGLTIPLFEGFRISEEVSRAAARIQEKSYGLEERQQYIEEANSQFDEVILSSEKRIEHLGPELKLAKEAFALSKKRYFAFQGDLLDVRATLTNMTRVLIDVNTTQARYLVAKETKEVFNGAR